MFTKQDIQQYIMDTLGKLRAETNWQKCNKNKSQDDADIDSSLDSNLVQFKHKHNKPQTSNKDN